MNSIWTKLDNLLDYNNVNKVHNELLEIIKAICNNVKTDKEKHNDDNIKEIIKFIGDNYHDNNLSIT